MSWPSTPSSWNATHASTAAGMPKQPHRRHIHAGRHPQQYSQHHHDYADDDHNDLNADGECSSSLDEELALLENAVASYEDVVEAGPPLPSPPFAHITVARKQVIRTRAWDRKTDRIRDPVELIYGGAIVPAIAFSASSSSSLSPGGGGGSTNGRNPIIAGAQDDASSPRYAYYIEGEYKRENKLGLVHVWKRCRMATRRSSTTRTRTNRTARPEAEDDDDDDEDNKGIEWEIQTRGMVVQCIVWGDYARRRRELCVRTEDARTEIAALQYIAHRHRHRRHRSSGGMDTIEHDDVHNDNLRPIVDVLQDDVQWWIITPASTAAKEDLFTLAQKSVFTDTTARFWFRQVLRAVTNLHRVGICHRNLGLESFLLQDDQDVAILSDFEFACRIPYGNNADVGVGNGGVDATDVGYSGSSSSHPEQEQTMRRLIVPEKICGKPLYLAPECWHDVPFDGVAIDVWAMGTMLLVMLTGSDPWGVARPTDGWYNCIVVEGRLEEALRLRLGGGRRTMSASAIDLLKRIFRVDPRDRPSLYEVQHHPWVLGGNGD